MHLGQPLGFICALGGKHWPTLAKTPYLFSIEPFFGTTGPPHGRDNFERKPDNSREVCVISLGPLLLFISRLDPLFI